MTTPVVHILPLTSIVRSRLLPVPGTVHVHVGQKVGAVEVIAETSIPREHYFMDVARLLGLNTQKADRALKVKRGDKVRKGAVIAEGGGLIAKAIRAPMDGRVLAAGGGQVILQTGSIPFELKAGYPGMVIEVVENRGVVIQSSGAVIQGIWGNGRLDFGLLLNLAETPNDILAPGDIDVSLRGSVLMGGHLEEEKALRNAAELPVRGLILGSMSPALVPLAMQMKFPIIVLDALGKRELNMAAYKLLSTNAKREIALVADHLDRYAGTRPEIVIPLPVSQELPVAPNVTALAVGQQVRLARSPQIGAIATVMEIFPGLTAMPNGLKVAAAGIKLENGEQLVVPIVNLEVVG